MATYNGEKYIREQIDSILLQINNNDELIITDDASTDSTVKIIKEYKDSRIKLFINEERLGYTKNFEKAIKQSIGEYIILSDQDDVWLKNRVSVTMNYLEEKKYDFFHGDAIITDNQLKQIKESHNSDLKVKNGFLYNFIKCRFLGCSMAFNAKLKKRLFPFPDNVYVCPHDYWIALIAEMYYKCAVVNIPLIYYRRHSGTTSGGGYGKKLPFMKRIYGRIYVFNNLLLRSNP